MQDAPVVVVEDDSLLAEAIRRALEGEGYPTVTAYDAAQGLRLALERRPRLLILDLYLPDGSGWLVLRRLAESTGGPLPPVVVISAGPVRRSDLKAFGVLRFLAKPFPMPCLVSAVRQMAPLPDRAV